MKIRLSMLALTVQMLTAQNFATLTGSVTDKTGASAAATRVTATNIDTQAVRETVSDDGGS